MNRVDRLLQQWRIRKAARWIPDSARVLDVGCFDDSLFRHLGPRLGRGTGLDARLEQSVTTGQYQLLRGYFPEAAVEDSPYEVITMLAVLEHARPGDLERWANACHQLLAPGGLVVATVPSPRVDAILEVLTALRIVDGMALEEHHGFDPAALLPAFRDAGFTLARHDRFQLGLNNLFVFAKSEHAFTTPAPPLS